jgi:tRNA dimethylallyltransferase
VLVGPTAIGKSAVAEIIAARRQLPVLSADSMQVYRGMDVGTAKPTPDVRRTVRYFGIDFVDPDREFSVAEYLDRVRAETEGTSLLLAVGGSGLYVRCLIEGLRPVPPADPAWRFEAARILSEGGIPALQAEARRRAPEQFASLRDPANPRRLVRAVELARAGGLEHTFERNARPVVVGLSMPPAALLERIRRRVERMFADGLMEEAAALRSRFPEWSATARQAIGYAEALTALDGRCTVNHAKETTVLRTRQLAKRQMTWFRHQAAVDWVSVPPEASPEALAGIVEDRWNQHGPTPLAC